MLKLENRNKMFKKKGWKMTHCSDCGGHGMKAIYSQCDFEGAGECDSCGGSGVLWVTPKGALVMYPSGPFAGRLSPEELASGAGLFEIDDRDISFIRVVRSGRIIINKETYVPNERHLKYDGRLDGRRMLFMLYPEGDKFADHIHMWGSEEHASGDNDNLPDLVDGYFPWSSWVKEERCLTSQ